MGYNDPVGDEHRQDQLLPRNRGLSDNYTTLFGDKTSIKHSDFRVSYIHGVKITVLSGPDYEQFVDNYDDLTDLFNIQSGVDKAEFGELQWYKYAYEKSNQLTTDERVLPFAETTDMGTWIAPQEMVNGFPNSQFNTPIDIDLRFGDTVEFEVVYGGTMGDKFKSFRRYDSSLFKWNTYDFGRAGGGRVGPPSTIIELPTTAGMMPGRFAWQARYMFKEAMASQIGPNNKIGVTFRPNDRYNDHDNMNPDTVWSPCCMITPKPADTSSATASMLADFVNEPGVSTKCTTSDAGTEPVEMTMSVSDLPQKLLGDSYIYKYNRAPGAANGIQSTAEQSSVLTDSLPVPAAGTTTTYTYTGSVSVTKEIFSTTYVPGTNARLDRKRIGATGFDITTDNITMSLTSIPQMGDIYVTRPWAGVPSQIDVANQNHKLVSQLSPALKTGPGLIGNLRRPSMLIDATVDSEDITRWMYFFTQPQTGVTTALQYYNSSGQWVTYQNVDDTLTHKTGYSTSPFVQLYSESALNWSSSTSWRVAKTAAGSTCAASTNSIDVVTVTDLPDRPTGLTLQVTYNNGNNVVLTWNDTNNKVIETDSETGQYQLKRLFVVRLFNATTGASMKTFTVDDNQLTVSNSVNSDVARLLVPKDKNGVSQEYRFSVEQIWQSTDMYDPELVKTWSGSSQFTETFQILDCSDPELRDSRTNNILANDSLLTCVGLNNYKPYSSTTLDYEIFGDYEQINPLGCRDYLTPVSCRSAYAKLVADVTCQVTDNIEFEFSGTTASGTTVTLTTANEFTYWNSNPTGRAAAATAMHINMLDDDSGRIYNSQLSMMLDPVLSTTTARKTVINYYALLVPETNPGNGGAGNRGEIEITRRENNIVGVVISDPGNNTTSGPAHSSVGSNTSSDRYKFKIYATVIDNE